MERVGSMTNLGSDETALRMLRCKEQQQHIFKVPQIPGWSRIPGACSRHSRRRISTTSQHILHLLDQFYHHHCSSGRPKNQPMHYSGHTFVNWLLTKTINFWYNQNRTPSIITCKKHDVPQKESEITNLVWFLGYGSPMVVHFGVWCDKIW